MGDLRWLQAELDELERTDPDVARAAQEFRSAVEEILTGRRARRLAFCRRPDPHPEVEHNWEAARRMGVGCACACHQHHFDGTGAP